MSPEGWVLIIGALTTSIISILGALKTNNKVNVLSDKHENNAAEIAKLKEKS